MDYPIVEITWKDTYVTSEWLLKTSIFPVNLKCKSIGFLISEENDLVVLASHIDLDNGNLNGVTYIPVENVLSMNTIEFDKKENSYVK